MPRQHPTRAVQLLDALAPLVEDLWRDDTLTRASRGNGTRNGAPPVPLRAAVLDARHDVDATLVALVGKLRAILGVGADKLPVPGWLARCWECSQATLLYEVVYDVATCTVCRDEHGDPYRWPAAWLRGDRDDDQDATADERPLTLVERLKHRITELETQLDHQRVRDADRIQALDESRAAAAPVPSPTHEGATP